MNKKNKKKRAIRGREHYYTGYHVGVNIVGEVIKEKISRFDKFEVDGWDTDKWMKFIIRECLEDTHRVGRYSKSEEFKRLNE